MQLWKYFGEAALLTPTPAGSPESLGDEERVEFDHTTLELAGGDPEVSVASFVELRSLIGKFGHSGHHIVVVDVP